VPLRLKQNTSTVSYSEPVQNTLSELRAASHSFRLHLLSTCYPHFSLSANGWLMKACSKVQLLTNSILKENASNIFLVLLDLKHSSYPDTLWNQHVGIYIQLVYVRQGPIMFVWQFSIMLQKCY